MKDFSKEEIMFLAYAVRNYDGGSAGREFKHLKPDLTRKQSNLCFNNLRDKLAYIVEFELGSYKDHEFDVTQNEREALNKVLRQREVEATCSSMAKYEKDYLLNFDEEVKKLDEDYFDHDECIDLEQRGCVRLTLDGWKISDYGHDVLKHLKSS